MPFPCDESGTTSAGTASPVAKSNARDTRAVSIPPQTSERVKVSLLIVSDTRGLTMAANKASSSAPERATIAPWPKADVLIHCGNLTQRSSIEELNATLDMINKADASLKIVIPGSHDTLLDEGLVHHLEREACQGIKPTYGTSKDDGWSRVSPETVRQFKEKLSQMKGHRSTKSAQDGDDDGPDTGLHYLTEGLYSFRLANGGAMTVYASPYTPRSGRWGFQFDRGDHEFNIPRGVDVVVTHGPPKRVLDQTCLKTSAGCEILRESVEESRPRLHCFGHVPTAWGAAIGQWQTSEVYRGLTEADTTVWMRKKGQFDGNASRVSSPKPKKHANLGPLKIIENTASLAVSDLDDSVLTEKKRSKRKDFTAKGFCEFDLCPDVKKPPTAGDKTLFVNASLTDLSQQAHNYPWMVYLDLNKVED